MRRFLFRRLLCLPLAIPILVACGGEDATKVAEATPTAGGSSGAAGAAGASGKGMSGEGGAPPIADCAPDSVSPNQTQATAHVLTIDERIDDLTVCAGAPDWFRFELPLGKELQAEACRKPSDPVVDFAFFREEYQEPKDFLGGGGSSVMEVCKGTGVWASPGTYFFQVSTKVAEAPYWLRFRLFDQQPNKCKSDPDCFTSSLRCEAGVCVCRADAYEPNDVPAAARPLPLGQEHELVGCFDEDWFSIPATAGKPLSLHLGTPLLLGYYFNLEIYAASDKTTPLAFYPMTIKDDSLTFLPTESGQHLLRVRNSGNGLRNYLLRVDEP